MTATIWKFPIPIGDAVTIAMPEGARIIHIAAQGSTETPCLWAIVDPDAPFVDYVFEIRGTGHDLGQVGDYLGTFMLLDGSLVFHVFGVV